MKESRSFLRFYLIPIVLFVGILLTAAFTLYYTFTTRTRDGEIVSSRWPMEFTLSFSRCLPCGADGPALTDEGKARLDAHGLWVQVLDASGDEVLSYQKPADVPAAYQPAQLLKTYQDGMDGFSVFVGSLDAGEGSYTYLIGFPMAVSKVMMYVDAARYRSGKVLVFAVAALTAVLVLTLSVYCYKTFRGAEKRRVRDEKAKEEWLANITHDLKTPLSPIRGYAELLSAGENASAGDAARCGAIILKNARYAEELVDDLKLTYQLQSDMLPLAKETGNLTRFVRETVIDILNAPEYEGRSIAFSEGEKELTCAFDPRLLRRALVNVVSNALKHNKPDAEVAVSVREAAGVEIVVADKGRGMTAEELDGLFTRYYRGASTEVKAEGSGLGMAIAKQIAEAHGGRIGASSRPGEGTTVTIRLPK